MTRHDAPRSAGFATAHGADAAPEKTHVIIIGGGASGVLLAFALLRQAEARIRVTLIEKGDLLGCGIAYRTTDPGHLLNTRAINMSARADAPEHFLRWLEAERGGESALPFAFVSRGTYGRYMSGLLAPWRNGEGLRIVKGACIAAGAAGRGVRVRLADGTEIAGDRLVLATGHALPGADPAAAMGNPWEAPQHPPADVDVLIVGSGLTMVDQVVSLLAAGHQGRIVALSRRGLLPRPHRENTPLVLAPGDIPFGAPISAILHWLRGLARRTEHAGGDWRDAVDGLRPHMQRLWRSLTPEARRRFLRHGAAWWEVHRHRMPPDSAERIQAAIDAGLLRVERGAFLEATREAPGRIRVRVRRPGGRAIDEITVGLVMDCRGIRRDPEEHAGPLLADLLASGQGRIDPLRIGLDVAPDCALIDRAGRASDRLFALGPASRAAFWEITAIPDIREQAATLAARLAPSAPVEARPDGEAGGTEAP